MRVLFLVHSHPELQTGGTELFSRDLFRALRAADVSGLYVAGSAPHQRPPSPGTPFQVIGNWPDELLIRTAGFDPFSFSQIDTHGFGHSFAELVREQQPDVVHIHHLMTLGVEVVSIIRRCAPKAKIVMTLHDYYPICANDGQMMTTSGSLCHAARPDRCHKCFPDRSLTDFKLRELHIGRALDMIDHFISPSAFLRERFIAWGMPKQIISVIPNGLPQASSTQFRTTKRRDRFAFFGHINRFKGATVALEASALLSKAGIEHRLSVHGSSDFQSHDTVARFKESLGRASDANYSGGYRRQEFSRLVEDADWVIFPSVWWENAPLVVSEALAHRRPVICSNIGGAAELVQDGVNGLHFTAGDPRALAEVLRCAVEERGLWQRLVDGISPQITIDETAKSHIALYNHLLATSHARAAA